MPGKCMQQSPPIGTNNLGQQEDRARGKHPVSLVRLGIPRMDIISHLTISFLNLFCHSLSAPFSTTINREEATNHNMQHAAT